MQYITTMKHLLKLSLEVILILKSVTKRLPSHRLIYPARDILIMLYEPKLNIYPLTPER